MNLSVKILSSFNIMRKIIFILSISFFNFIYSNPAFAETTNPVKKTVLQTINEALASILFFDVSFGSISIQETGKVVTVPLLVLILFAGALFFTFYFKFINIRAFPHAISIISGKFDNENEKGDITHFKALTSALSATVGLGNIAGVAIAIQLGGPGAVFWMLLAATFGMSTKFVSCTLSQMYRKVNQDGSISGGPMYYIEEGLKEKGNMIRIIGIILSSVYAIMIMGGALGAGNMFQSNQSFEALVSALNKPDWMNPESNAGLVFGIILAIFVGLVIIGGVKRIGSATSKIVPAMCGIYVMASLFILITNFSEIPHAFSLIFKMAFSENALYGGVIGVMIWGIKRASFSNEAGLGSSAIVHAAAKTSEPVREGMVAMLEPFIDTIIVCTMTALVVIVTGAWNDPNIPQKAGVALTSHAFSTVIDWFPIILSICVILFAYSTMISWCYYGERGWNFIFDKIKEGLGQKTVIIFRVIFLIAIIVGSTHPLIDVLNFSDVMVLSLAIPNILACLFLISKVKEALSNYQSKYMN